MLAGLQSSRDTGTGTIECDWGFTFFFFAFSCAVPELIFVVSGERKGLASVGGDVRRGLLGPAVNLLCFILSKNYTWKDKNY